MSITPESVEQLLNSEDFGERLRAVNQLRQLEPAIAYKLIQSAIGDKNVRVRYAAVSQLSTLGTQNLPNALEVLRNSLNNDPEPDVQAAAADALGALKLTDALEDLQQVYSSTSEWLVQLSIVAALGEMGDPKAFPMLENALTSENELIQTIAISALGELGDKRALPLLLPYASNADWQIRYRVAQALGRLGGAEAQTALEILAKDEVEQVAQEAKVGQENSLKS
ncbi:phycobilisome degradation protein NblB [Microcoleus sp. Pol12B5]|uniref:phycobilisome degradation protein NblB n=1 Tax=Microcoleus sp. Pol12B5 TaxID=3055396 RepID=UPI002FD67F40